MKVELKRLLTLETPVKVNDGAGGFAINWTVEGTLWAEVVPGAGSETAGVEVSLSKVPYRITVRGAEVGSARRPRPEQRLKDGTRVFTILAVTERDSDGRFLTCFAREEEPK
ncbi:head-tail adaptor protein [Rhodobacter sp. KR11]|uniref:head-tail adaptor protein n=1 Tax=Rhodobacter sp. KR11 TaxID=2974588 RepID=UPI00222367FE|nr:head-tail adaptor protein [Rhodobacter sp. KR11]MCW1918012.1 head-tail adaptor protein [Rhodobacter sp. KR11]